jgi:hypothetical protein
VVTKKLIEKPQSKNVTRCSGTSQLFSIDVVNATSHLSFVVTSKIWMPSFCSWLVAEKYGCILLKSIQAWSHEVEKYIENLTIMFHDKKLFGMEWVMKFYI